MSENIVSTSVEILGRSYSIRCHENELKSLHDSAAMLDKKMLEIQSSGKAINLERIAVMAGLNIAHELINTGNHETTLMNKINQQIIGIQDKIENMLTKPESEFIHSVK